MAEDLYQPLKHIQSAAHVQSMEKYREMYEKSVKDPEGFWSEIASTFYWKEPPQAGNFLKYNFDVTKGPIKIEWMPGAKTNLCYNVLDRHIDNGLGEKVAFYWEGNEPGDEETWTFVRLRQEVCRLANFLKSKGLTKGDRVAIYMPMVLELPTALLACARLGLVHSVVFGGFSAESLADRIIDGKCAALITADGTFRGTKFINLKEISDKAITKCKDRGHDVPLCVCVRHVTNKTSSSGSTPPSKRQRPQEEAPWDGSRDVWWSEAVDGQSDECDVVWLDSEDPSFMLYTSGSTGKPKGVLHTVAGYMLWTATTFKYDFDYRPDDVYWCTADVGWITGHSYIVYGPMANGATNVLFEGTPFYPDAGRFWQVVDKYKVTKFYTAPTAIRALMRFGDDIVKKSSRESLQILGTVGEPINPEAWLWYYNVIGNKQCAIVDTFWQTETGGHMLTPLPGATPCKPGSATFPFFGVVPALLTEEGEEIEGEGEGYLVFKQPWPGVMRTVYGDHQRFETTYFKKFPGYYVTGDGCRRDADGYYWVTGRIDDMLNVSGHLLSTAEIESALVEHPAVAEAAVVAQKHPIKGECTYCFVTPVQGVEFNDDLVSALKQKVRVKIGPFAAPEYVQKAPGLPKTRSGKIMRRVLRKVATGDKSLGDTSTLADETVVEELFENRPTKATFFVEGENQG